MRRARSIDLMIVALLSLVVAACGGSTGIQFPTGTAQEPGPTATLTPTAAVSNTMTATEASTATPSPAPTTAPTVTASPSPPATPRPTAAPTAAARWLPAGKMNVARSYFAAVPLRDGTVLVVGHDNNCTPGGANEDSVEAELFDGADTWAATSPLNAPRDGFATIRLRDGRVLVTGGLTGATATSGVLAYSSARIYDPKTGTWSKPGLMHVARYASSAALLADGRVLVAGGIYIDENSDKTLATAELFDPGTGNWSATGAMRAARSGAPAVTLQDGRILVVGGSDSEGRTLRTAEIFDPDSGRWSSTGSLSVPRAESTLTLLPVGGVLAVGGSSGGSWVSDTPLSSAERFDPSTGTWSPAASMATPRALHVAALLGDGTVLVAGGNDRALNTAGTLEDGFPPPTASAEIYDPMTDSWTPTTPMRNPRAAAAAVTLADGSVLVAGGYESWGPLSTPYCPNELATAERYVPAGG